MEINKKTIIIGGIILTIIVIAVYFGYTKFKTEPTPL